MVLDGSPPACIHTFLFPYKLVSVLIFSNSLQNCKHFTSSARRRLFRFSLFLYY